MLLEQWRVDDYPVEVQLEALGAVYSESHLPFLVELIDDVPPPTDVRPVMRRRLGNINLVDAVCPLLTGFRKARQIHASPDEYVCVLVLHSGAEIIEHVDRQLLLSGGEVYIWDSVRPIDRFVVRDVIEKQTLFVPRARFQQLLPRPELVTGQRVAPTAALELFVSYLRFLTTLELTPASAAAAGNAALELLAGAVGSTVTPSRAVYRDALRLRIKEYIEQRLGDPTLGPASIAMANALSLRSLHSLFADEDDSVSAYIRRRRLGRAHAELTRARSVTTITEIAQRLGFVDPAHFSRAFRDQYGMAPTEARRAGRAAIGSE